MPKRCKHVLIWSQMHQHYHLSVSGQPEQCFSESDEAAFSRWLDEHTAFAFVGQAGRLSAHKETKRGGIGYWYAYRTHQHYTHKRYLGSSSKVTFGRLEEVAKALTRSLALIPPLPPSSDEPGEILLKVKLSPPRLPLPLVQRSRLLRELDAALTHPLTLVSASAGSGKTTLLSAWVVAGIRSQAQSSQAVGGEPAVAWLSLEELDNDPIRFWSACIAALQIRLPTLGQTALAMLHAQEALPLPTCLICLLREIEQVEQEFVLILDDYHVISDKAIHDSMHFLLDHLPANFHLMIASRTEPDLPLPQLRAHRHLLEIRDHALRFTEAEAASFLRDRMGLPLSEEGVAILQTRTEGWIAGLQLAALSLHHQQALSVCVRNFAGSHHLVQDYVQQDILARVPEHLQAFVLQTSILTRMNASLCQAVTEVFGQQRCQQLLEEVERTNLFVVPLDEQRRWYRYHDLFREALLARLHTSEPNLVPLLHIRAAGWYEQEGKWREAIAHALAAADHSYAAALMMQAAPRFWLRGEARTVHTWVLSLPDAVIGTYARFALDAALRFLNSIPMSTEMVHADMSAQVERTMRSIEAFLRSKAQLALREVEVALIERRLRLLRAMIEARELIKHGDKERLRLLSQELETFTPDEEVNWKIIPLSFAYWLAVGIRGEGASLIQRLQIATQQAMKAGDHLATIRISAWLAHAFTQAGQLQLAQRQSLEALSLIEQIAGNTVITGYLYATHFDISYARNRLEEASDWQRRLMQIAEDWQQVQLLVLGEKALVQLSLAQGKLTSAYDALQKLEALFEQEGFATQASWVVAMRVRYWLAGRNLSQAVEWAAHTTLSPQAWNPLRKEEALMLVWVSLAQQRYTQAVETLERFREHLDRPGDSETTMHFLALYAVALHQANRREQATCIAARLLALTEPEGHLRLYLDVGSLMREVLLALLEEAPQGSHREGQNEDSHAIAPFSQSYILRLLAALQREEESHPASLVSALPAPEAKMQKFSPLPAEGQSRLADLLSPQEQQILRLLARGLSRKEIARELVISLNTVKTHLQRIYQKLHVTNRMQACERARQSLP